MTEMPRRDFVSRCALCLCSAAMVPAIDAVAEEEPDARSKWLQSQIGAARLRYAMFINALGQEVGAPTKKKCLQALGRECAMQYRAQTFDKYKGDIHAFLKAVQGPDGWVQKAEYNEHAGLLRIIDKQSKCSCPLVEQGVTSPDQCECTLGWQKETYSRILGKPVEAEIEESILRGGTRCVFRITISS